MIRLHRNVTVLKLADPALTQELNAVGILQEHARLTLSPNTHLLRTEETQALVKKLIKLGYKPRVEKS